MNNNIVSRNRYNNSLFIEESSPNEISFPPDVFKKKFFKDLCIQTNILQNISQKETQIYKLFRKNLGKHFFGMKPTSLLLFEKRLQQYFQASNFLNSFSGKKSINFNDKINIGSLDFLALSENKTKNEIFHSLNPEKILSISKNFSLKQSKDIITQEFFKVKYIQKNAKRIAKILNNKKNKNTILELKAFNNKKNIGLNINNINIITPEQFIIKRRESDDAIRNNSNKYINININSIRKNNRHNTLDFKSKNNLGNLQIFEYINKNNKPKINKNYWLNTSNILLNTKNNNNKDKEIISSIFTKRKKRNNLTDYYKTRKKKFINSRNSDISFYINKYHTHTNYTDRHTREKNEKLFLLDLGKIKKLSKKFKLNINNNINGLNDYTKECKSKLLRLLYTNNIDKKLYIIKKEFKTELNELKDLLFGDIYNNTKNKNGNEEKLNKENQDNQEKNSNTMEAKSAKKLLDANGGIINKKIINLEIKELIKDSIENKLKKGNIKKVREKCKENYTTILKLRENLKYKREKFNEKFRKLISKK